MRLQGLFCAAVVACVAVTATSRPSALGRPGITPIPCPDQAWEVGDPQFEALPGAKAFFGKYDGGLYRVEIPDNWNGELALYAHGFVSNAGASGSMLRVGNSPIREHLIKNGFAWAASSYRCNGYVPGQGLVDTMALTELFTKFSAGRAPQRVLLTGTSMGGHVTVLGMHEFPTSFVRGLAMCPAGPELFDFFAAVGGAAEVITGIQFKLDTMQRDLAKMNETLGKAPDYTDKGRQLASVEIQISGGPRPFAVEGLTSRFAGNISGGALAGSTTPTNRAVMTTHIKYAIDEGLGLTADALNSRARRKALDADVRNPMGPYDEIVPFDGKLERPLLTMHGTGDLFVPIVLQQALKRAVVASGKQDLLVQRMSEERAFQLLGLGWSGAATDAIQKAARALVAEQRADGGWSQLPTLTSDAYATGQALVALAESGALATTDPAYKRGVQFLLSTQFEDGSWFVKTRAIALQPLFEIGFPHGRDQWISAAGTNWAAMALARAYTKPS